MNIKDLKSGSYRISSPVSKPTAPSSGFPTGEPPAVRAGFLQSMAQGIASPFLRVGASVGGLASGIGNTAQAIGSSLKGDQAGFERNKKEAQYALDSNRERDFGYLGKVKPVALQNVGEGAVKSFADAAGVGAEIGSYAVGGGGVKNVVGQGLKGAIKGGAIQGAKAGLVSGALAGGGKSLQEGKSALSVIGDTVLGGAIGGVSGAVLGGAISGVTSKLTGGKSKLLDSKVKDVINDNYKGLKKLDDSYKVLNKISKGAEAKGYDVKKVLAESDLLHGVVDTNGHINTKDAIIELNDFMKPQEGVISKSLQREGRAVPLESVRQELISKVNESGLKGGAKLRALKAIEEDIAGYALDATPDGMLPVSVIHDAKVDKYANINYLNPESKRADKAIANGLKSLVENNTDSVDVKALNGELAQFYAVQKYLEALDGRKVEGGKLGRYFAQTIGAVAGSHFGPFGTIIGAETAGRIKGLQMASNFSRKTGKILEHSDAMKSAISNNASSGVNPNTLNALEDTGSAFLNRLNKYETKALKAAKPRK